MLTKIRRRIAYALAPELLAARTLAEFAHDVVARAGRAQTEEIASRDRGIARLARRLKAAKTELAKAGRVVLAATDLFDNRMGYTSKPGPWAHPEFWIDLGIALYGETDERVIAMQEAYGAYKPAREAVLPPDPHGPVEVAPAPRAPDPFEFMPEPRAGDVAQVISVEDDVLRPRPMPTEWPPRPQIEGLSPAVASDADELGDENVPF